MPTPGIQLIVSNTMETLLARLASTLADKPPPPMVPETIVVQSKGMERWITLNLALAHGVAANYAFPFPNKIFHDIAVRCLKPAPAHTPFDPENLTWRIMSVIADDDGARYKAIRSYIGEDDPDGFRCYQLSRELARLYDQYLVYRPDMVVDWETKHSGLHWQAQLWREMTPGVAAPHKARLLRRILDHLTCANCNGNDLPPRISIVGISSIPPFHLRFFHALSAHIPVYLYLLNPCREYWGDIPSPQLARRYNREFEKKGLDSAAAHLHPGNALLSSCAQQSREFIDLVYDMVDNPVEEHHADPGRSTLLRTIQSEILSLEDGGGRAGDACANDGTVQVHACHSPLREVEVLHDVLLRLFDRCDDLNPRDILIMCPDIDTYAPYIEAVFSETEKSGSYLPFTIADRSARAQSDVVDTLMTMLDLVRSPVSASDIMKLLEAGTVRRRFGIRESDVTILCDWVDGTNIRWGVAGDDQAYPVNTWRAGMDRMILGHAMCASGYDAIDGILPYAEMDDGNHQLLAAFLGFLDTVLGYIRTCRNPQPLVEWSTLLLNVIRDLFDIDRETGPDLQRAIRAAAALKGFGEANGFHHAVPVEVVQQVLLERINTLNAAHGFIAGDVTFCGMVPMRNIPFRVIGLIGMNEHAFPRADAQPSFDLLAQHPKPGDRSRRSDDRQIFIDALLSARDALVITHIGRSIKDNAIVPPSVLVSELIDYAGSGFNVTYHRLHAFDPTYFGAAAPDLYSYSAENARTAETLADTGSRAPVFFPCPLTTQPADEDTISIGDLVAFYRNPSRHLLRNRLGIDREWRHTELRDRETFQFSPLEAYGVNDILIRTLLDGDDPAEIAGALRVSGQLPHGPYGDELIGRYSNDAGDIANTVKKLSNGAEAAFLDIDIRVHDRRVVGRINQLYPNALIHYSPAAIKGKRHLQLWIWHLLLNIAAHDGAPRVSRMVGKKAKNEVEVITFAPVNDAFERFAELVSVYVEGECRPIPFFPETSWEYVTKRARGDSVEAAVDAARKRWSESRMANGATMRGDGDDPWVSRCFPTEDFPPEGFHTYSEMVFAPILQCTS